MDKKSNPTQQKPLANHRLRLSPWGILPSILGRNAISWILSKFLSRKFYTRWENNSRESETLTDGLGQSDDHVLAGRLLGQAADDPHDSIHPHFELHLGRGSARRCSKWMASEVFSGLNNTTWHWLWKTSSRHVSGTQMGLKAAGVKHQKAVVGYNLTQHLTQFILNPRQMQWNFISACLVGK